MRKDLWVGELPSVQEPDRSKKRPFPRIRWERNAEDVFSNGLVPVYLGARLPQVLSHVSLYFILIN